MKVTFERSGSFAGMLMTATVDTEILPTSEAEQLRQLIQATDFFHLPSKIVSASSQPDRFQYKITAEDGNRHHIVQVNESVVSDQLRSLLNWLT
ncbi:MAG: hypothetical protein LH702_20945, partial [Phormidesmis sp. CAN_BIN44]|nr:hypothetical protein [Phormidesmis sp. CAN_BIN44]